MKTIQFLSDQLTQCSTVRVTDPIDATRDLLYNNSTNGEDDPIFCIFGAYNLDDQATIVFERPVTEITYNAIKEIYNMPTRTKPLLLEYDDAIWEYKTFLGTPTPEICKKVVLWNTELMKNYCDGIVVSTEELAKRAKAITNKPVIVLENAVDYYEPIIPAERNKIILYTGNGKRNGDVSKPWIEALKEMKDRGYKVISTYDIPGVTEPFQRCRYNFFKKYILTLAPEFYIAPLADTYLNRGRSNLKELEAWRIGAKFVGQGTPYESGIPFNATKEDILEAFDTAKVPTFGPERNINSVEYAKMFATAYSGIWLGH